MKIRHLVGLLLVLWASGGLAQEAAAQARWLQHVEIITPVQDGHVTRVLLDSLVYALQAGDAPVRRSPDESNPQSFHALEEALLSEGLDFTSATHLFIDYQLTADQRGFNEDILHLYFIYRPADIDAVDIPIVYLDASAPLVRHVLHNSGVQLRVNEAAFVPFLDQLTFYRLPESTVVKVAGRIIRDPQEARAEKERLLGTIRSFTYN